MVKLNGAVTHSVELNHPRNYNDVSSDESVAPAPVVSFCLFWRCPVSAIASVQSMAMVLARSLKLIEGCLSFSKQPYKGHLNAS
jgi:hypothetical protein